MSFVTRIVLVAALGAAAASPVYAQRGRGGRNQFPPVDTATPPIKPDTANPLRKTANGAAYALDFQDQDLRVVLSAVAEAGGLNVALANIPTKRVTLRMSVPASRAAMLDVLRGLAAQSDLKITEGTSLIRVEGTVQPTQQQQLQQVVQAAQLKLFTYRLKHASAVQVAPVLSQLFSGAGGGGNGQITIPNAAGNGFTVINPGGGVAGVGGGGGGGRGGGGGGGGGGGIGGAAGGFGGGNVGGRGAIVAPTTPAQQILQALGGGGLSAAANSIRIVAEETSNSLIVRATQEDWALIQQIVQSIDLRPLQVLIEVTIVEVQRTHDLEYGISGTATHKITGDTAASFPSAAGASDFILALTGGKGTINFNYALNALQSRGDVKILSLPVVIAQNNRQAMLNVGEQRPFVQLSQSSLAAGTPTTVQTIQYLSVGTVLTITPTINPDGYVNLQVDQTDNSATSEIEFSAPVLSQREAQTQVFLHDGQTTVIGGLAGNTTSHTVSGIPILSRIPLIGGMLFGNTQHTEEIDEIYLFLTPHIISTDEDVDKLRNAVQGGSDLLKQVPTGARFNPVADTIHVPTADSIRMLRQRADSISKARLDSIARSPGTPVRRPRSDTLTVSMPLPTDTLGLLLPRREEEFE